MNSSYNVDNEYSYEGYLLIKNGVSGDLSTSNHVLVGFTKSESPRNREKPTALAMGWIAVLLIFIFF